MGMQQEPQQPQYGQTQVGAQFPSQYGQQQQMPYGAPPPMLPQQPPKKGIFARKSTWFIIVALLIFFAIAANAGKGSGSNSTETTDSNSNSTTTQSQQGTQPAAAPTQALQWTTTHTFTGNGSKKTEVISVPDDWKIIYNCTYQNIDGVTGDGALTVSVYNSDGSVADPGAIDATCKNGVKQSTGQTEEHQSGQVYLDINGTGDWTIKIQEQK